MLIKQIRIKNFKSHEDTVLDLHAGINTIYGNPQAGKSNIMRGLELLKDNRPIGAKFMPKWAGKEIETHISVLDEAGIEVGIKVHCKRNKTGKTKKRESTYYYIQNHNTGELKDFTGVGKEVPAEITKALNLTDINIQLQKDPPFLATNSGSKISKTVNKITGLDIADALNSHLTKKYNEQRAIVKNVDADIKTETENIKDFSNTQIQAMAGIVKRIEKLIKLIDSNSERIDNLNDYLYRLEDLSQVVEVPDLDEEISRVTVLNHDIHASRNEIDQLRSGIRSMEALTNLKAVPDLGKVFGRVSVLNSEIEKAAGNIKALQHAVRLKEEFKQARQRKDAAGEDYIAYLAELQKCPTCFQSIDKAKLKQIIQGVI
jgi:exonuclease SbcC